MAYGILNIKVSALYSDLPSTTGRTTFYQQIYHYKPVRNPSMSDYRLWTAIFDEIKVMLWQVAENFVIYFFLFHLSFDF